MTVRSKDILLWNGLRSGSENALHSLYICCYNDLLRYGVNLTNDSHCAKEHINAVFLDLWKNRHRLPEAENPKAYIITSYKNKIIFRKKKAGDFPIVNLDKDYNNICDSSGSIEQTLIEMQEYENLQQKVKAILLSLTERQRQLIVLRFIEEKTYEQIAEFLNISIRTVYNSIHESMKLLRRRNQ